MKSFGIFGFVAAVLLVLIVVDTVECRPQFLSGSEDILQTVQQTVLRLGRTITETFAKQILSAFTGGASGGRPVSTELGDVRIGGGNSDYDS